MDARLLTLIRDYQSAVRLAVTLMSESGIVRRESDTEWSGRDIPQQGELLDRIRYWLMPLKTNSIVICA